MEVLEVVEIAMNNRNGCKEKYPHMQMDEHCKFQNQLFLNSIFSILITRQDKTSKVEIFPDEIKINSPDEPKRARIIAFSVWGILRSYTVGFCLCLCLCLCLCHCLCHCLFVRPTLQIYCFLCNTLLGLNSHIF